MRAAASCSALSTAYAQLWTTAATLRIEANRFERLVEALEAPAGAGAGAMYGAGGAAIYGSRSICGSGCGSIDCASGGAVNGASAGGMNGTGGSSVNGAGGVAAPAASGVGRDRLHEAARAMAAVEGLLPQVVMSHSTLHLRVKG